MSSVIPESNELLTTLMAARVYVRTHGIGFMEVRLQVYPNGQWQIHEGAACYDQNHHGYWGAGEVYKNTTLKQLRDLAADLTCQAADMEAEVSDR